MLPIHYLILIRRNGSPYSEVTVVNLPSSLMIVHSNAFVYSTSLLVVVSRYGFLSYIIAHLFHFNFFFHKLKRLLLYNKDLSHRLIL
jgi:hypothetical protein